MIKTTPSRQTTHWNTKATLHITVCTSQWVLYKEFQVCWRKGNYEVINTQLSLHYDKLPNLLPFLLSAQTSCLLRRTHVKAMVPAVALNVKQKPHLYCSFYMARCQSCTLHITHLTCKDKWCHGANTTCNIVARNKVNCPSCAKKNEWMLDSLPVFQFVLCWNQTHNLNSDRSSLVAFNLWKISCRAIHVMSFVGTKRRVRKKREERDWVTKHTHD